MPSWLIPALKAVLPHVGTIVDAARPVFTRKKPEADIAFGFSLTSPDGDKLHHLPKATVRITLVNERDEVVFDATDELANFLRAESTRATFLYLRGVQNQAPGPDGGWGTYAHPRKSGRYRMTVETLKSNVTMTKFTVRLMGVDGRWK